MGVAVAPISSGHHSKTPKSEGVRPRDASTTGASALQFVCLGSMLSKKDFAGLSRQD
jgi:hypothetical protein